MYVRTADENSIISFITGYETGSKNADFTMAIRHYLENKLRIPYSSDGWNGQISRYSLKNSVSWMTAFKQLTLEMILSECEPDDEMKQLLRTKMKSLIDQVQTEGHPSFDKSWTEEWNSLFNSKKEWIAKVWTADELRTLKAIDNEVKNNQVFKDWKPFRPTQKLEALCKLI
jgi:hypothetical protein